jgi:anti-sigma factor RsiW
MSDDTTPSMSHPEELLATYVGGSLEPSEREAVEGHLAVCDACRREVEYATAARAALVALPELEPPGLAEGGLAALGVGVGPAQPADLAERRAGRAAGAPPERWHRLAWSAGLAAAAVVAAVFLFTGGLFGRDQQASAPASRDAGSEAAALQSLEIVQGGDRDPAELDALARSLAASADDRLLAASPTPVGAPGEESEDASSEIGQVIDCVREGAALGPEIAPTYLEEATFEGAMVYIGAFVVEPENGGRAHLELVAVTADECQPVYFARQNL